MYCRRISTRHYSMRRASAEKGLYCDLNFYNNRKIMFKNLWIGVYIMCMYIYVYEFMNLGKYSKIHISKLTWVIPVENGNWQPSKKERRKKRL